MPRKKSPVPVVVSRWFAEGHYYARSPDIDEDSLDQVANALKSWSQNGQNGEFEISLEERLIIGIREEDKATLDPKAEGRHPFIIRAAILPKDTTQLDKEVVSRQLRELRLPQKPGPTKFPVYRFCQPEVPSVPIRNPGFVGWAKKFVEMYGIWLLIGILGMGEVLVVSYAEKAPMLSMVLRLGLLVVLGGIISLIRKPWPCQESLGDLEWQLYDQICVSENLLGEVASGARIIKADGSCLEIRSATPIRKLGVFRDPDSSVTYYPTICGGPGWLVVSGEEFIVTDGRCVKAAFSRTYVWSWLFFSLRGRWQLVHAQWTLLAEGETGSRSSGGSSSSIASRRDN